MEKKYFETEIKGLIVFINLGVRKLLQNPTPQKNPQLVSWGFCIEFALFVYLFCLESIA